jgi:hypothetical protein
VTSPTNWIIHSGQMVHVGDVVIGAQECRARITGVAGSNGYPVLTYESGQLTGSTFPTHPFKIQCKVG